MKGLLTAFSAVCAIASASAVQLFQNGTYITGQHPSGAQMSEAVQYGTTSTGAPNSTAGWNTLQSAGFGIADDFVVPTGQTWDLQNMHLYMYQTNAGTTNTITSVFVEVYNGVPGGGGVVVAGDTTTNRLSSGTWSNVYRVFAGSANWPSTARAVMDLTVDMSWVPDLPAGTYWVAVYTLGSTSFTGPWWVPVTEIEASDNAVLLNAGTWAQIAEAELNNGTATGNTRPRDFMFILNGNLLGGPQVIEHSAATLITGLTFAGTDANLLASDDVYWAVRPGPVASTAIDPVQILLNHTLPGGTPTALSVTIESRASTGGIRQIVEVENTGGTFDNLETFVGLPFGTSADRSVTLNIPVANHVLAGNQVHIRIRSRATTPVATFPWRWQGDREYITYTP